MPSIEELQNVATELNATLTDGLDDLDNYQQVTFTKYVRRVLPLDGFVFWVNSALVNSDGQPTTQTVDGYIHLSTNTIQDETELYDRNAVIFTAKQSIDDFNEIGSATLYIGTFFGVRFAFSQRTGLNTPADLYHYFGHAIYPQMESQIIDSSDDLDLSSQVVSSSLPLWMDLNVSGVPLYPAMLSDQNIHPPYATAKCDNAREIAAGYFLDKNSNQSQLVKESVKISFTGLRNAAVMDFIRYVNDFTLSSNATFGITNTPVVQDERVPQNELNAIVQRKVITYEVNYYQQRTREIARGLILKAIPNIYIGD